MDFRPMQADDWPQVAEIYRQGIATRNATFETTVPDWQSWDASHLNQPRLVAKEGTAVLGWAALSSVSSRCVYGGVAEVSVYVAEAARGQKVGLRLLELLVQDSESAGIWTLQAGIFPENTASIKLHERCGFRVVGTRERLGQLGGVWRDVVVLERRSAVCGV
jgi:L-amino acid N-acyltransferase YncA